MSNIKHIKLFSLVLVILSILSLFPHSAFARYQLFYGDTVAGSISSPGEKDVFEFNGTAGDVITIRFAKTSGNLNCYVELFDPKGNPGGSSNWGVLDALLLSTGTFKITLRDYTNTNTGDYSLSLQRLNNPVGAIELSFGQTATGNINAFAKIISYKFSANTNDMLYISLAKLTQNSGDFIPLLQLYDAIGRKIAEVKYHYNDTLSVKVNITGEFYLLATDYGRDGTGTYELTLQRTNNPANLKELNYNSVREDSIETFTKINAHKFIVNANDTITICSAIKTRNSGYFSTCLLELFNTTGVRLASGVADIKYTFGSGGTFYLFITGSYRDGTGSYNFILLKGNISCPTIDITSPQVSLKLPKGSEIIESGSKYNITWFSLDNKGITSQQIRLSTDSGLTYPTIIASGLGPSIQAYEWQIPKDLFTAQARIKVIAWDAMGNHGEDSNKRDFIIRKNPVLPSSAIDIDYEYDKLQWLTKSSLNDIDDGYDELHQPPKNTLAPFNFTTSYSYDALGNRLKLRQTKTGPALPAK